MPAHAGPALRPAVAIIDDLLLRPVAIAEGAGMPATGWLFGWLAGWLAAATNFEQRWGAWNA